MIELLAEVLEKMSERKHKAFRYLIDGGIVFVLIVAIALPLVAFGRMQLSDRVLIMMHEANEQQRAQLNRLQDTVTQQRNEALQLHDQALAENRKLSAENADVLRQYREAAEQEQAIIVEYSALLHNQNAAIRRLNLPPIPASIEKTTQPN